MFEFIKSLLSLVINFLNLDRTLDDISNCDGTFFDENL